MSKGGMEAFSDGVIAVIIMPADGPLGAR